MWWEHKTTIANDRAAVSRAATPFKKTVNIGEAQKIMIMH